MKRGLKITIFIIIGAIIALILSIFAIYNFVDNTSDEVEEEIETELNIDLEDEEDNNEDGNDNSNVNNAEDNEDKGEEGEYTKTYDYDEVLVDSDVLYLKLDEVIKTKDFWDDEYYEFKFELENKTEDKIEVSAENVSMDDMMIDEDVVFYETITGGKKAISSLVVENYDEEGIPEFNDKFEFELLILDEKTYDNISSEDVTIEAKSEEGAIED